MSTTYWEERRRDRQAEREERRRDRQQEWEQRRRDREDRRRRRAEQMARLRGWARDVAAQVPWLVIMGAPMVMSWAAMAAYGVEVYGGPIGALLPLFSEASLLVFALASARAAKEGQPTALLRLGVAIFAGVAAVLNFVHGAETSVTHGLVMAVVSVGGVAVHQLVHGRPPRPRRTWQQRQEARLQRQARRRVYRLRRAAIRSATPVLRADGSVSLVYSPGALEERRRLGRTRVETVPAPAETVADEVELWLAAGAPGTTREPLGTAETGGVATLERAASASAGTTRNHSGTAKDKGEVPLARIQELAARVLAAIEAGELPAEPSRRRIQRYLEVRSSTAQRVMQYLGLGGDR